MSTVGGTETREQITDRIPLPTPSPPFPAPAWHESEPPSRVFVVVAFGFLLALAFLLASSPVRNTDFWLHLADGKRIAEGTFPAANDPSCYAAAENGWTHRSWLYDVVLFHLFNLFGGTGLAYLKALMAAGLAAVMVLSGKKGNAWGVSLACTALAFLALSPWLALRPILVSYLFLALTLWLLERRRNEDARAGLGRYWPLPVLFAVWVNIDAWFFLGPLIVGCYFLGGLAPRPKEASADGMAENAPGNKNASAWILGSALLLGLAACLFNPYFLRAFAIGEPLGLSEAAVRLQEDPLLRRPFALLENYYFSAGFFRSVPGLAFWILAGLGLASFALIWRTRPWERLLSWTCLFLLCLLIPQAVPFFCIAAGPILATNWSAFREQPSTSLTKALSGWNALGQSLVLLALFLLVAVAWSGWMQNDPGPRRWAIEMEPSLAEAGKQIDLWRNEGVLQPEHHGFHFSPEASNVFAWLCPQEESFFNAHQSVSAAVAAEYVAVRNGLLGQPNDWRAILRRQGVSHIVLYNNDQRISEKALHFLMETPEEWQLVYQRGRVAIFAWREPVNKGSAPPSFQPFNAAERAFSLKSTDRASDMGPENPPAPFHWWDAWWRPRPVRSLDVDEAHQELTLFHAARPGDFRKARKAWLPLVSARVAGIVGVAGSPHCTGPRCVVNLIGPELLFPVMIQEQLFLSKRDLGPPAHLYLAIRAARRAIKANPDSAAAYWALGDTYYSLARLSREATYQFPLLVHIRSIQTITAYQQALLLNPNLEVPRRNLIDLYQKMGYLDLMYQQIREFHKRRPRLSSITEEQRRKEVAAFANAVRELEEKFALASADLKLAERARLANKMGLADTALKILLASDVSAFGGAGLELELRLLLETGKARQVRDWLEAGHENQLGTSLYYLVQAKRAAADGDYRSADQDLQTSVLKISDLVKQPLPLRDGGAFMVGNAVLSGTAGGPLTKFSNEFLRIAPLKKKATLLPDHANAARYLWELNFKTAEEAKIDVLRGLLALEAGEMARAHQLFSSASKYWQSQGGMVFPDAESQSCRLIAQQWLQLIDSVNE